MKRKVIAITLTTLLTMGLTACGNATGKTSEKEVNAEKKTLVVYYSATGNTQNLAELIAEKTSGDLFELEPVKLYTEEDLDWTNDDSRVSAEHGKLMTPSI